MPMVDNLGHGIIGGDRLMGWGNINGKTRMVVIANGRGKIEKGIDHPIMKKV